MTKWWKMQCIRSPTSGNRKKSVQVVFCATQGEEHGGSCNFLGFRRTEQLIRRDCKLALHCTVRERPWSSAARRGRYGAWLCSRTRTRPYRRSCVGVRPTSPPCAIPTYCTLVSAGTVPIALQGLASVTIYVQHRCTTIGGTPCTYGSFSIAVSMSREA
jgi:hypothetical protein